MRSPTQDDLPPPQPRPQPEPNPFLPYHPDLFVANLSPTHVCLLNKFNVIEHHLLVVTRAYEEQENLLTAADFGAVGCCLTEIDGLAFYNGGTAAGASQPHKHLQLVKLPLLAGTSHLPIEPALDTAGLPGRIAASLLFPFIHALVRFPGTTDGIPSAAELLAHYHHLFAAVGLPLSGPVERQPAPYNLLLTRRWMLLVLRSRESAANISVNALGFAGSLFVRSAEQMAWLRTVGPFELLRQVGVGRR